MGSIYAETDLVVNTRREALVLGNWSRGLGFSVWSLVSQVLGIKIAAISSC